MSTRDMLLSIVNASNGLAIAAELTNEAKDEEATDEERTHYDAVFLAITVAQKSLLSAKESLAAIVAFGGYDFKIVSQGDSKGVH